MNKDLQIFDLIAEERSRQMKGIELIASENFVSDQVMAAMGSVCTNKYAEGYPAARYYGGCEVVDKIENLAIERICKLYGAAYANVQPHSGAQANMAVFFACLKPGDTFMGLDLSHGGHLSHGSPVNMSGMYFKAVGYKLKEETGNIDYDEMEALALEHKPKLIVGGASAFSREWDYKRLNKSWDFTLEFDIKRLYDVQSSAIRLTGNNPVDIGVVVHTNADWSIRIDISVSTAVEQAGIKVIAERIEVSEIRGVVFMTFFHR